MSFHNYANFVLPWSYNICCSFVKNSNNPHDNDNIHRGLYTEPLTINEIAVHGKGSVEAGWPSFHHLRRGFQYWVKSSGDDL